jgi:hypothetical protein
MSKIQIIIDRKEPSNEEISKRKNFDEIMRKINLSRSLLRSPWFYGAIGFSGILSFILLAI